MGCCGEYREKPQVQEIHKWHYINLRDFKSKGCLEFFSYMWVWILSFISVAVYVADTYTAVKLLAFNQWSSQIQPTIPFHITKWIFAGCILASWALCVYEWWRAIHVMKKESVTEDYLDPLAVVLQSIRIPSGWRRFLVFAELTKSKKKAAWVAIFVYFQRKGAIRILAAEGPRYVVNGITLYDVANTRLIEGPHDEGDPIILSFFKNIRTLAIEERTQALILSSMAFTLVIWVISMLLLFLALLFYVFFIWHYVKDETLTGYCRRKVETRLAKIVKAKTDKIWAKQERQNRLDLEKKSKEDSDDAAPFGGMKRQPTLPVFDQSPPKSSGFLSRTESVSTLPRYQSQPGTPSDEFPPPLPENAFSTGSASLLNHASPMGQANAPFSRPQTSQSNRSYASPQSSRGPSLQPNSNIMSSAATDSRHASNTSESSHRYSPPWRPGAGGNGMEADDESASSYEMTESSALPAALRPAMGPRRDVSSPAAPLRGATPFAHPPARSFTSPAGMPPPGRSGTPGTLRSQAQTPGPRGPTPGPGGLGPRSHTPGDFTRGRTPGPPGEFTRSQTSTDFGRSQAPGAFARSDSPGGFGRNQSPGAFARSQTPGAFVRGQPSPGGDFSRSQTPGALVRGQNGSSDFSRSHTPGAGMGRGPEQHSRGGSAAGEPSPPWGTGPPGMAF